MLVLNPLGTDEITTILQGPSAMKNAVSQSYSRKSQMRCSDRLAHSSGGDARVALAALEAAVESTEPGDGGVRSITSETVIEALGRARYAYDKRRRKSITTRHRR